MAKHTTRKNARPGRQATIARRQARALKYGQATPQPARVAR